MFLALVHAYIFAVVYGAVESRIEFLVLDDLGTFMRSAIPGAFIASLVVTSPLAFAAGCIGERPFLLYSGLSFALAWAALITWNFRLTLLLSKGFLIPPTIGLVAMACFGFVFFTLGSRARKRSASG